MSPEGGGTPRAAIEAAPLAGAIRGLAEILERNPRASVSIEDLDAVEALNALVQRKRRQSDLDQLRAAVADPLAKEADLQKLLERMLWVFGGEFLPEGGRRALTTLDRLDLSLIRPDGSLHGVELKQARIKKILQRYRDGLLPGFEVYKARWQAMKYLDHLDEQRSLVLQNHTIDTRRATMTVVIGSAQHADPGYSAREIAEAFRVENTSNARVWLRTYDELVDNAQRLLSGNDVAWH